MDLVVNKVKGLKGAIEVSGDKSISHRAVILGAVAKGETRIRNFLRSDDCLNTVKCLQALGVRFGDPMSKSFSVFGTGLRGLREPEDVLDVGNSGTTLRILPGILAGQRFFSVLTGDGSVRKRPIDRIVIPLTEMGARFWAREQGKYPPLAIRGGDLRHIKYKPPVASAQVKTAVLLAGLMADGTTVVTEKSLSRDHTERMLQYMLADIEAEGLEIRVKGGKELTAGEIDVPGDFSSAAFFVAAALITSSSRLTIRNVGVNSTRTGLLDVIQAMGAEIGTEKLKVRSNEPRADLHVSPVTLKATNIGGEMIPKIIDELPVLAVLATQAEGKTVISEARELRLKETDRIKAVCTELKKMGARIQEREDGFEVEGPTRLQGTSVKSYGDHRMAMALAVAGLAAEGSTTIEGAECITTSLPEFDSILKQLVS